MNSRRLLAAVGRRQLAKPPSVHDKISIEAARPRRAPSAASTIQTQPPSPALCDGESSVDSTAAAEAVAREEAFRLIQRRQKRERNQPRGPSASTSGARGRRRRDGTTDLGWRGDLQGGGAGSARGEGNRDDNYGDWDSNHGGVLPARRPRKRTKKRRDAAVDPLSPPSRRGEQKQPAASTESRSTAVQPRKPAKAKKANPSSGTSTATAAVSSSSSSITVISPPARARAREMLEAALYGRQWQASSAAGARTEESEGSEKRERFEHTLAAVLDEVLAEMHEGEVEAYTKHARQLYFNLRRNDNLRGDVLSGDVDVDELCGMSIDQMAPALLKEKRDKLREEVAYQATALGEEDLGIRTDKFECPHCHSRDCVYMPQSSNKICVLSWKSTTSSLVRIICRSCSRGWMKGEGLPNSTIGE